MGGDAVGRFDLVELHEAVGEVAWIGESIDGERIHVGDIVVPVVRRCQEWDEPEPGQVGVDFSFRPCKEAHRCPAYRHPDVCPKGEYPHELPGGQKVGYRSRGTGKCHGFGSEFFIDTAEWLVPACSKDDIESGRYAEEFLDRLILVEPLAVVWKMRREIEQVRRVRPLQDRMLTLGLGPIGYLATAVMCTMYPGLRTAAVDRVPSDRQWIKTIRDHYGTEYVRVNPDDCWHDDLRAKSGRFDIVVEATGSPSEVIAGAIDVLAPNGILVLLSVVGGEGKPTAKLTPDALNAVVKKNIRIIGSVNESRTDFENSIEFLKRFYSRLNSPLDALILRLELDPGTWRVIDRVKGVKAEAPWERRFGPKVVLAAPKPSS